MGSNHNLSNSNTSFVRMFRSVPFAVGPRKSPSSPNLVTDLDYSAPISDKKVDLYVVSTGSGAEICGDSSPFSVLYAGEVWYFQGDSGEVSVSICTD